LLEDVDRKSSTKAEDPPPCSHNQMAYAALSNGDLAIINMGPITGSGKTQVHFLDSSRDYVAYRENDPIQTRMHPTAETNNNGEWTFLMDGNDDLLAINSGETASNMTEVHRLKMPTDRANPYQTFDVQVITAQPHHTAYDEWDFLLDSSSNLMLIKKGPSTESSMTEIHVMKAAQSWQQFVTTASMQTGLHLTSSTSNNGDWTFLLDGADNLLCIRRPIRSDQSIEVKRLTAGSNYQAFDIGGTGPGTSHSGGASLSTWWGPADTDVHWAFVIDASDDILCIREGYHGMGTGKTQIHKLAMATNYTTFTLHQENSAAPCLEPHWLDSASTR